MIFKWTFSFLCGFSTFCCLVASYVEHWVVKDSSGMCIWDFLDAEVVKRFEIHLCFCSLEFRNWNLSVINRQENNKFLKLTDIRLCLINWSLNVYHRLFFFRLWFENGFHCLFTFLKLLQFRSIGFLLLLTVDLHFHYCFSSLKTIVHSWDIEVLTFQPYVWFSVWIFPFFGTCVDSIL